MNSTKPLIYQVHVRPWIHRLSREHGRRITLDEVPEHDLEVWSQRGVTHVWLMGVWSTGPQARQHAVELARTGGLALHAPGDSVEEVCGSPYAIVGYEVDEALGGTAP